MACPDPLFCFPGTPVENDPRANFPNKFKIGMLEAPVKEPLWFFYGCCCPCCSAMHMRILTLGPDWPNGYRCCQGYLTCCGFPRCTGMGNVEGGGLDKSLPHLCLCLEASCCTSCAISVNRFLLMDKYNIVPDPMDNKIIHFNNCLQLLSCLMQILACVTGSSEVADAADLIRTIANLVAHLVAGCMTAQGYYELFIGGPPGSGVAAGAPIQDEMTR